MKYHIAQGGTLYEIMESVNYRLVEGWDLRGDVVFCPAQSSPAHPDSMENSYHHPAFFIQVMTK